jgi:predicted ATP-dependent protease
MLEVLTKIFSSEFFWGIVIGVALSIISAFSATRYQAYRSRVDQNQLIRKFLADAIENIVQYGQRLADHRERAKVIDHEFLNLVDTEIGIYGRNREHLSRLDDDALRKDVLEFFNRAASYIVRIRVHLNEFQKYWNEQKLENIQPSRKADLEKLYGLEFAEANKSCDSFIGFINGGTSIAERLKSGIM